jgi:integrase
MPCSALARTPLTNASRVLARILAEAERSRMIPRDPAAHLPSPPARRQEMRFLSPDQIAALSEAVPGRHRALILMAAYTGLRWGELAALMPAHLDLLRGVVDVREALSEVSGHLEVVAPKTGERRSVPLAKFLCDPGGAHGHVSQPICLLWSPRRPLRRHNFYKRTFKQSTQESGSGREGPIP